MNSEIFWETKKLFAEKYGAVIVNTGGDAPIKKEDIQKEFSAIL